MKLALIVMLAGCSSSTKATTPAPVVGAAPSGPAADPGPALAKPLAGPFPTLEAFCATQDHSECQVSDDAAIAKLAAAPLGAVGLVYVAPKDDSVFTCAFALRTAAGWFVTPPTKDTCREPGYIDLTDARADVADGTLTYELDLTWHTNHYDAEASFTLTTLCSTGAHPACIAPFTSKCEQQAPASDCNDNAYTSTWQLDGGQLSLTSTSKDPSVPTGTHRLF